MPAQRSSAALKLLTPATSTRGSTPEAADADLGGAALDFGEVPELLDAVGKDEWRRLGALFADHPTRFREADRVAVLSYCAWFGSWHRAHRDLARRGHMVRGRSSADRGRQVRNPSAQNAREAGTQLRYWARELGLTPDARVRLGLGETGQRDQPDNNPFA